MERTARAAWIVFVGLVLVYNANGREIPTYDSQPTKITPHANWPCMAG